MTFEMLFKAKQSAHAGAVRQLCWVVFKAAVKRGGLKRGRCTGEEEEDALSSGVHVGLSTALPIQTQPRRRPERVLQGCDPAQPGKLRQAWARRAPGVLFGFILGWLMPQVGILRPWEASAQHRWMLGRLGARGAQLLVSAAAGPRGGQREPRGGSFPVALIIPRKR